MKYPNFSEEKMLWKQGFELVAGLDEVGRGPGAGPVVAAAVIFPKNFKPLKMLVRDSKKMSAHQREKTYKILIGDENIKWGIGIVSEKIIDKINILEATKLAMQKAVENLYPKLQTFAICGMPDFLLLDGNFTLRQAQGEKYIPQKSVVKGDVKIFSCAAASIIAKVTRDKIMCEYDKKYPQYGFKKHKGYLTALHRQKIKQFGLCQIHRKSFRT